MANVQLAVAGDDTTQVILSVPGVQGPAGSNLPPSGTTHQLLYKQSSTDYDTAWKLITNDNVDAAAEIAVSKLADGSARQLLQTDAAGTGVEWTSNVDIPGTLDVTSAATFDAAVTTTGLLSASGKISVPLASGEGPSIYFGTDTDTGIYSPGANQVALSTSGTGKLFIDSAGKVTVKGVGTAAFVVEGTAPDNSLVVKGSTGNVGIGTSSPGSALDVAGAINLTSNLTFSTTTSPFIAANAAGSVLRFGTGSGGVERLRIDSSGRVGIGSTAPDALLTAKASSGTIARFRTADTNFFGIDIGTNGSSYTFIESVKGGTGSYQPLSFWVGGNRVVDIDTSGRLLVGTPSAEGNPVIQAVGAEPASFSRGSTSGGPNVSFKRTRGNLPTVYTAVTSGDSLGVLNWQGADGSAYIAGASIEAYVDGAPGANDMPGRLVFSTTADEAASPTERFRITNDGVRGYNQSAPAAVDTTATLTVANLKTGIITSSTAAAVTMTLPTGTLTEGGFAVNSLYNNFTFEWTVINTGGANAVTVQGDTGHTLVGSGTVAAGVSGRFASRRTAANTFVTYRLS